MNYAFLPDLSALTILVVILFLLHRRHPQEQADIWLLGLFFTLVEATAHTFYAPDGVPARGFHVVVLDCYVLAGLIFTWAAGDQRLSRKARFFYMALNGLPLLGVATTYGLNIRTPEPYLPWIAVGLVVGVVTSLYMRRSWLYAGLFAVGWLAMGVLVRQGDYRHAVYWSLCCVYSIAALNFHHRLPRKSTGRLAILTGFLIWSICFLVHPWIVMYREYADIASHVWNMQKSLISMGMILVMLEEQVANNEWLALHDELTGLPNRRLFTERFAGAIEHSRHAKTRLALIVLDLNGFKAINDSLGHQAGDEVLREVAKNLSESVRTADTLARHGGDEFTLIASDLRDEHSVDRLEGAIRDAVEKPISIDGQRMMVTACIGVAIYPDDSEDASKLLRIADQRMYSSKQRPKPQLNIKPDLISSRPA